MPNALPWIMAGTALINTFRPQPSVQLPPPPPTLTMEEARRQAEAILNPLFNEQLQETLRQVQLANIRRGFFGQAPGAELSQRSAADIESRRAQNIAQLASQLQGMTWDQAAQHAQLAMQAAQLQANDPLARMASFASIMGGIQQMWPTWWSQTFSQPISNPLDNAGRVLQQGWLNPGASQATASVPAVRGAALGGGTSWISPY